MNLGSVMAKAALILALILVHGMARSLPPKLAAGPGMPVAPYTGEVSAP
jgi:hypothetical protein